jgi:hypothetical protein
MFILLFFLTNSLGAREAFLLAQDEGRLPAFGGHDRGLREVKGTFLPFLPKIRGAR